MVIDLFYFYNELDLLEMRLEMYGDLVDKFIIVDADVSFAGEPHEPMHPERMDRFNKWKDKIEYYVVKDYPNDIELMDIARNNSNVGAGEHYWVREFYIKESVRKILTDLKDDDIIFISDVDEFWNPKKFKELTDFTDNDLIRPTQQACYYYVNNFCSEERGWTGTTVCKYKMIKDGLINDIRTRSKTTYKEIADGGWHFGFLVGLGNKMAQRRHPEYDGWIDTFEYRAENNIDYRGRNYSYWLCEDLPDYLINNKEKWKKLFR